MKNNSIENNISYQKYLYSLIKEIESKKNEIINEESLFTGETFRNLNNDFKEGIREAYYYAGAFDKLENMKRHNALLRNALELKSQNSKEEIYLQIPSFHRIYFALKFIFISLAVSGKPVLSEIEGLVQLSEAAKVIKRNISSNGYSFLTENILTEVIAIFDDVPLSETCNSIINTIKKPDVQAYKGGILFIRESEKNKFLKFLKGRINKINISEPANINSDLSSKPGEDAIKSFKKLISLAEKEKCKIYFSEKIKTGLDTLVKPLMIDNILPDSEILNSTFNLPIIRIISFRTPSEFLGKIKKINFPYHLNSFSSDYNLSLEMIKSCNCLKGSVSK